MENWELQEREEEEEQDMVYQILAQPCDLLRHARFDAKFILTIKIFKSQPKSRLTPLVETIFLPATILLLFRIESNTFHSLLA